MDYSYAKTIKKSLKYFVIFILPWLVSIFIKEFPAIANLTVGGILVLIADYLKNRLGVKLGGLL